MNQLVWDTIVEAARELGHPTQGKFAQSLWILCSGQYGLLKRLKSKKWKRNDLRREPY